MVQTVELRGIELIPYQANWQYIPQMSELYTEKYFDPIADHYSYE